MGFFHGLQFACKNKLESHYDYANEVDYNKYYYGITLGAGIAIKVRKTWIPVKLQYRYYFWGTKVLEGVLFRKLMVFLYLLDMILNCNLYCQFYVLYFKIASFLFVSCYGIYGRFALYSRNI